MMTIEALLALNGVLVVFLCSAAGFFLYRNLLQGQDPHAWHLLHAGGTARGILLIALAGTIELAGLEVNLAALAAGLVIVFVWASTLAMLLRAVTGETGFQFSGRLANRLGFALYGLGVLSLFPGLSLLAWGLARAL